MYMTVGRKKNHMPSEQHVKMQRNWMERLAFQSNAARTPKCDNSILKSARHTLWHAREGKSGAGILPPNLFQFFSPLLTSETDHTLLVIKTTAPHHN